MLIRLALARFRNVLAAAALAAASTSTAWSQSSTAQDLLEDFTHYALIANVDLAVASAQALMNSGISNAELATLLDEGKVTSKRFEDALARAHMVSAMASVAAELEQRVEAGRLDLARDPKRIEESVKMLTGAQRARTIAKQRLAAAKEYAVPALLQQITEGSNEQLRQACQDVLVQQIGGSGVAPLCEALMQLTGASQRIVCDILGAIKYPSAAPYLRELAQSANVETSSREAAARAYAMVGGLERATLTSLYSELAARYFEEQQSLIVFPNEDSNNVWSYSTMSGLSPTPVPTAIFSEVMAMRIASRALRHDSTNTSAIDLFVAANLKRENDLPEGASDPIYGSNQYTSEFYATVFGTQTCLNVLGMGIDRLDTPLVRDAILALSKTTGGSNLFARGQGRQPLLEALNYPDRRVQYEGALTLGRALPQQSFSGDSGVVQILASAVRIGNKSLAMAIVDDEENRRVHTTHLEQAGFEIVGAGANLPALQVDIAKAVGVDLVVVRMNNPDETRKTLAALRGIPKTSAAPVVVIAGQIDASQLGREYREDRRVNVVLAGVQDKEFVAAIEAVMKAAAGGRITEAEAEEYAIQSLAALRDIAVSRNPVYHIAEAESALIDALNARSGGTRELVADILALIDSDTAQRTLFDAALDASDEEQVTLLLRVADSVRTFGDRAEKRHVDALVDLIAKSSGATADAAAAVHGALNMSTTEAVKLIPQS